MTEVKHFTDHSNYQLENHRHSQRQSAKRFHHLEHCFLHSHFHQTLHGQTQSVFLLDCCNLYECLFFKFCLFDDQSLTINLIRSALF